MEDNEIVQKSSRELFDILGHHIIHIINNWLKYVNSSKQTSLPYLTKTVDSPVLQGNGPCHFVKCTVQSPFHPVEKHFVTGIYLMLSLLSNGLSQCWTVHYRGIWLAEDYICAPKQGSEYLFFLLKYFSFSSEHFEKHVLVSFCVIALWGFLDIDKLWRRLLLCCLLKWMHHKACSIIVWNKEVTKSYFSTSSIAWKLCMRCWTPLHQCL